MGNNNSSENKKYLLGFNDINIIQDIEKSKMIFEKEKDNELVSNYYKEKFNKDKNIITHYILIDDIFSALKIKNKKQYNSKDIIKNLFIIKNKLYRKKREMRVIDPLTSNVIINNINQPIYTSEIDEKNKKINYTNYKMSETLEFKAQIQPLNELDEFFRKMIK